MQQLRFTLFRKLAYMLGDAKYTNHSLQMSLCDFQQRWRQLTGSHINAFRDEDSHTTVQISQLEMIWQVPSASQSTLQAIEQAAL